MLELAPSKVVLRVKEPPQPELGLGKQILLEHGLHSSCKGYLHHEVRALGVQTPAVLAPQPLCRLLHLSPGLFGQPGDADDEAREGAIGGGGGPAARGGGGGDGRGGGGVVVVHPGEHKPRAPPAGDHLHPATRHRWWCGRGCCVGRRRRRHPRHACAAKLLKGGLGRGSVRWG